MRIESGFFKKRRFQWQGFKNGVSRWKGDPEALRTVGTFLGASGTLMLTLTMVTLLFRIPIAPVVTGSIGIIHAGAAWWLRKMYRKLSRLATQSEIAESLGVDQERIGKLAEEQRIRPKVIINNEERFDPTDFDEGANLLRASEAPADDLLLRPAGPATHRPETLLQPAEALGAEAPVQIESAEASAQEELRVKY